MVKERTTQEDAFFQTVGQLRENDSEEIAAIVGDFVDGLRSGQIKTSVDNSGSIYDLRVAPWGPHIFLPKKFSSEWLGGKQKSDVFLTIVEVLGHLRKYNGPKLNDFYKRARELIELL